MSSPFSRVQSRGRYLSDVRNQASSKGFPTIVEALSKLDTGSTRVFYINESPRPSVSTPAEIIAVAAADADNNTSAICIVENISPEYIEALGSAWSLRPDFFVGYASCPGREHLWYNSVWAGEERKLVTRGIPYEHINGNFEYHGLSVANDTDLNFLPNYFPRHCFRTVWDGQETINSNTRISYYRVFQNLYLFLVDAPLSLQRRYKKMHRRIRPTLRLPYAENSGGLQLPRLIELDDRDDIYYSIFENLKSVFLHGWQRRLLFIEEDTAAFPVSPLCYVLSNSLWQTNLRYLRREIRRIIFEGIRNPDLSTNEILHDRREDLVSFLKAGLAETNTYIPDAVRRYFADLGVHPDAVQATRRTPVSAHYNTMEEVVELEKLLMETFQLLMSSISVQDARLGILQSRASSQQAMRATQLTILASIYVPLSFVIGVFGMNMAELNDSKLSIWVFFVTAAIAAIVTGVIFWGLRQYSEAKNSGGEIKTVVNIPESALTNLKEKRKDETSIA